MPTSGRDSRDRVDLDRGLVMLTKGEGKRKGRATVPMTDRLRATLEAARPAARSVHVFEYAGRQVGSV